MQSKEWDEDQHPRDENGRFGSGDGGVDTSDLDRQIGQLQDYLSGGQGTESTEQINSEIRDLQSQKETREAIGNSHDYVYHSTSVEPSEVAESGLQSGYGNNGQTYFTRDAQMPVNWRGEGQFEYGYGTEQYRVSTDFIEANGGLTESGEDGVRFSGDVPSSDIEHFDKTGLSWESVASNKSVVHLLSFKAGIAVDLTLASQHAMHAAALKLLTSTAKQVLDELAERGITEETAERFAAIVGQADWNGMMTPLIADAMKNGADSAAEALTTLQEAGNAAPDVTYSLEDIIGSDALSRRVDKLTGDVTKSTTDALQNAVDQARVNGEDRFQLADRVQDIMGADANDSRALTIATTESYGAENNGTAYWADKAEDAGYGVTKVWHHDGDDEAQPRETHLAADGEEQPNDQPFSMGLMFPHDPDADAGDVINCQCRMEVQLTLPDGTTSESESEGGDEGE